VRPVLQPVRLATDWPKLKVWLETNSNALLREAYRNGNIEQIFTVFDPAGGLISDSPTDILSASKKGAAAVKVAEASHDSLKAEIGEYRHVRRTLLWAMEAFFLDHNDDDHTLQFSRVERSPQVRGALGAWGCVHHLQLRLHSRARSVRSR
jgi:hypothetical protein